MAGPICRRNVMPIVTFTLLCLCRLCMVPICAPLALQCPACRADCCQASRVRQKHEALTSQAVNISYMHVSLARQKDGLCPDSFSFSSPQTLLSSDPHIPTPEACKGQRAFEKLWSSSSSFDDRGYLMILDGQYFS